MVTKQRSGADAFDKALTLVTAEVLQCACSSLSGTVDHSCDIPGTNTLTFFGDWPWKCRTGENDEGSRDTIQNAKRTGL